MNPLNMWIRGYRDALLEVFGYPHANAVANPSGLPAEYVEGASAAGWERDELVEYQEADPDAYHDQFGRGHAEDHDLCFQHATERAQNEWNKLCRAEDHHIESAIERERGIA